MALQILITEEDIEDSDLKLSHIINNAKDKMIKIFPKSEKRLPNIQVIKDTSFLCYRVIGY